jgi:hypothetical protein
VRDLRAYHNVADEALVGGEDTARCAIEREKEDRESHETMTAMTAAMERGGGVQGALGFKIVAMNGPGSVAGHEQSVLPVPRA